MADILNWGIAGFGWVARDFTAPAIEAAGHRLAAIADPDLSAQAHARARQITSYGTVEALAADERINAVYVATPNHLHRPMAEVLARAGKAVLCEKPMAATLEDAEAMVEACRTAGTLYGTAFDQRHHPVHRALRSHIADGAVGTVTAVRIAYACWLGRDWGTGPNWRIDRAQAGGGAVMDLAPHGLDLVEFLLGEPVIDVHALLQRRVHDYAVDDGGLIIGRTASGVLTSLHNSYNCPEALPRRRLEVLGTKGQLTAVNSMGQDPGGTLTFTDGASGLETPVEVPGIERSPFAEQIRAFSHALLSGDHSAFSPERDLHTMRLLDRIYRSAA